MQEVRIEISSTEEKTFVSFMVIEYITTRDLESSSGKIKGKVRILKLAEETEAAVEYACPECGFVEKRKELWKEPFIEGDWCQSKIHFQLQEVRI